MSLVGQLIGALDCHGIDYCHWKSNRSLLEALSGGTDIDLLVDRKDAQQFRAILGQLDFRPALAPAHASFPAVEHYYGLDEDTGLFAHIHAYFRVVTGESLTKNYRFPFEQMLLRNTRKIASVRVPTASAELVVFTLRMMIKHTSFTELALLARDPNQIQQELTWLLQDDPIDDALNLVDRWLPSIDRALFSECITALRSTESPSAFLQRIRLARQLRSQLQAYARHSVVHSELDGIRTFLTMAAGRLTRRKGKMVPQSGGAVIAFVGPEATGKSTLLREISNWLGEHFEVERIHAGKPKPTVLSMLPNVLLPALRRLLPTYRSGSIEAVYISKERQEKPPTVYPLIFAIRSVLLGYDRWSLLKHAYRQASSGVIVLSDRYPSLCPGAPDSPQLSHLPVVPNRYPIRRMLARVERRLYREIPPPDIVLSLRVPLEVAILRNKTRGKREPEDFVRLRHSQSSALEFGEAPVFEINSNQPLDATVLAAKRAIWKAMA